MSIPEQEQNPDLVAPMASQVAELVTAAVKQILLEERSLLVSNLINEVNSHLSATLKSYFEEQLVVQKQEFQAELQTKIDELKFQHYQQLERLGQAVEEVMSSQSSDEFSEEILDDIYDELAEIESNQFDKLDFESEFFDDDDLDLEMMESETIAIAQNIELEARIDSLSSQNYQSIDSLDQDEDPDELESELLEVKGFDLEVRGAETPENLAILDETIETSSSEMSTASTEVLAEILERGNEDSTTENVELSLAENFNDISFPEVPVLVNDFAEFNNQAEEDEEFNQFESELFGNSESSQPQEEKAEDTADVILDNELSVFAETVALETTLESNENDFSLVGEFATDDLEATLQENSADQEELSDSLHPFTDLSIKSEELEESPEIIYTGEEFDFDLDEISLDLNSNQIQNSSILAQEDLTQFHQLFGDDQSEDDFASSFELETSEIGLDNSLEGDSGTEQDLDLNINLKLNNLDTVQGLLLNSEFEQIEQNLAQETEDLQLDDELNFFADTIALDDLNEDMQIVSEPNLEDEFWQNSDPFADFNGDLEHEEFINAETLIAQTQEKSEIIYEVEEYEPNADLEMDLELEQEIGLNIKSKKDIVTQTEENRLSLELEQELDLVFSESLAEIGDGDLSEFADLEAENDFWNSAPEIDRCTPSRGSWHLGIDFGFSGIRACLFNQDTSQIYPLEFNGEEQIIANIDLPIEGGAIALQEFKQFLRVGIPYQNQDQWQPQLKWINNQTLSLMDFRVAAQQLFNQLDNSASNSELNVSNIIESLETVILGHPHSWSDAYIFNLREAVLESGLVNHIEQVLVIDQAIATTFPTAFSIKKSEESPQLFIDSGALTTTFGFTTGSKRRFSDLEYAGLGITQDIVLQLLFPKTKDKFPATKFIRSGEPNPIYRTDLQQHLLSSGIGINSLAIAEQVKLFFSEQPLQVWQGNVGGKPLKISRSELEIKVIQPFIQSLNDAIDQLIMGTDPEDISQIAIAGGTTQLPSINQWLEAKFANAEIKILPSSNLAQGLAIAPLFSQYLDINRHQYSDFFLLSEICALNLQEPISLSDLIKKIQNRGVNAKACGDRLAKVLSGQLPAGILPWQEPEKFLFFADPNLHPHLLASSLFTPLGNDLYDPNPTSTQLLGAYLKMLESSINQSFSEPLVFPSFAIS